jgi:hypothetical protein
MGVSADVGTYTYVHDTPVMRVDPRGLDDRVKPEAACELIKKGYNPPNDSCGCQKNVVIDLCSCYTKYPWFWQAKQLSVCVEKAYLTKTQCEGQDCSSACRGTLPAGGLMAP